VIIFDSYKNVYYNIVTGCRVSDSHKSLIVITNNKLFDVLLEYRKDNHLYIIRRTLYGHVTLLSRKFFTSLIKNQKLSQKTPCKCGMYILVFLYLKSQSARVAYRVFMQMT
jgi:hypothetical protein